jgi:hypothetical protein
MSLHQTQDHHLNLRMDAINYLHKNEDDFGIYFENQQERLNYIRNMQMPGRWGGELEMAVLSKLYNLKF